MLSCHGSGIITSYIFASSYSGMVEVFGSWNKVAPQLGMAFDVEKQLEEAMREHEPFSSVTVVSTGNTAKTGFHPLDGSQ